MTDLGDTPNRALLPPGFTDTLAPNATCEAEAVSTILAHFAAHGFLQVKPPLVEFEETLFGGIGAAKRDDSFRMLDPQSHRMLAVRPDMTVQIARIAASRLGSNPRPLRLSYAGPVLHVTAGEVRPEREFTQLGAEIIGATGEAADAHIISLAVQALGLVGISAVTVDLTLPGLIGEIIPELAGASSDASPLAKAIEGKDVGTVSRLAGAHADLLVALIDAGGPAEDALAAAQKLALPPAGSELVNRLAATIKLLQAATPNTALTVDFVERRGFEYQSGVGFTLFAKGLREELGRGGSYIAGAEFGQEEPATGVSLFMDSILRGLPNQAEGNRILVPFDLPADVIADLQSQGWITVLSLDQTPIGAEDADRQGCTHFLADNKPHPAKG